MASEDFILFPGVLPYDLCDRLIAFNVDGELSDIVCSDAAGLYGVRTKWQRSPEQEEIFGHFFSLMNKANERFRYSVTDIDYLQFNTYFAHPKSALPPHVDILGHAKPHPCRKLSMTAQLTDPSEYEGSDLHFVQQIDQRIPDASLLRQRGSVIFFPSYSLHYVTPCTRGSRMALIGWFTGPELI